MANKTTIKFVVLGYGIIGKRHAELLNHNPETELVAICDTKPKEDLDIKNESVPFFDAGITT